MDFFQHQDRSRRASGRLLVLFALAVIGVIVMVYLALMATIFYGEFHRAADGISGAWSWWQPEIFAWTALVTGGVIVFSAIVRTIALSRGGPAVAESLGGRPVDPASTDPAERRLLNVVQEMAIAAGIPVPAVYVLENEDGINAFAAGRTTGDAAVAVTRGCLQTLSRDELQGVVGHEFSHILNGDMRLNVQLIGWLSGLMAIAIIGRTLLYTSGRSSVGRRGKNSGASLGLVGLGLLLVGLIGVFFGRIIQAAVSRQREYLADASAVQFTRNPGGLAGALKKIGAWATGSRVRAPSAAEAGHLFFGSVDAGWLSALNLPWFATHPPLDRRIRQIEPAWDGNWPVVTPPVDRPDGSRPAAGAAGRGGRLSPAGLAGMVGQLTPEAVEAGGRIVANIPVKLRVLGQDPLGAAAIVCALLLDRSDTVRAEQLRRVEEMADGRFSSEVRRAWRETRGLPEGGRLPLLDLSMPALRGMSDAQYRRFAGLLKGLIETDGATSLFEFCLWKMVQVRLDRAYTGRHQTPDRQTGGYADDVRLVLAILARAGAGDETAAVAAFAAGAARLAGTVRNGELPPASQTTLERLDPALDRLASADPARRREVLDACAHCALHDRTVKPAEAELLRALAACLDLPLPSSVE